MRAVARMGLRRHPRPADAVGGTPLVELPSLSPRAGVKVMAKLEGRNPTGSIKDRVARSLLDAAEASGELTRSRTVLEPTSGNTGIALAMLCAVKGYRLRVVMPDNVTPERAQLLRTFGAEIVLTPGSEGSNGSVARARELAAADPDLYMPYQYGNPANPAAHYDGTALEILEQTGGRVDAFVAGLGTGGTLMGHARRFRDEGTGTKIVAAEPMQGELVSGLRSLDDGFIPPIIDIGLVDRKIMVSNLDAIRWSRRLLQDEGLFVGVSTGAAARVAVRIAEELDEGTVVFVSSDDGWKYLSAGVYDAPLEELEDGLSERSFW